MKSLINIIFAVFLLSCVSFAQSNSAYKLLIEASALKNKEKNCPQAIEVYEKSLAIKDFRKPFYYQSLASCYAQTKNDEKALIYLEKMFSVGWLDSIELQKDETLKSLLNTSQGKKFLAKVEKAKAKFAKELLPENYGIAENPAFKKIENWKNNSTVSAEEFFRRISEFNEFPQPKKTGIFVKFTNQFSDKITAPFYVYIPTNYNANKPHSLLVYSQGGWFGRKEFNRDEAKDFVFENPVLPFVEKENFLEIFPAGMNSVGTYQFEGIENIRQIIAKVKQIFNVDDNRVFMMGFSDGGTGAYRTAVFMPTDFAAFYAVNGRPFTGNHFVNMSNRPFYSLSSVKDSVVEIDSMRSFFNFAKTVNADWIYREIPDQNHYYLPFLDEYLPAIFSHLKATARNPFRAKLNWETSWEPIGQIDWLEISQIDLKRKRADWHKVYEYPYKSSEGNETVKIGDESAAIEARYFNHTFEVQTSCVAKFTLNLHPAMIDFSQPVKVIVNGKEVFNQKVSSDKEFIAKNFAENFDRSLLWANKIVITVEN
ncbi:MAG: hypothetical protein K1X72_21795 [Pyrinomonadaceae bacterium]|nr:hypothetical protein [Pyrinomonadaceae bacterium]